MRNFLFRIFKRKHPNIEMYEAFDELDVLIAKKDAYIKELRNDLAVATRRNIGE